MRAAARETRRRPAPSTGSRTTARRRRDRPTTGPGGTTTTTTTGCSGSSGRAATTGGDRAPAPRSRRRRRRPRPVRRRPRPGAARWARPRAAAAAAASRRGDRAARPCSQDSSRPTWRLSRAVEQRGWWSTRWVVCPASAPCSSSSALSRTRHRNKPSLYRRCTVVSETFKYDEPEVENVARGRRRTSFE